MEKTIIDYLSNLINIAPFISIPELSSKNDQVYKIHPNYAIGKFRILKFDGNQLLILIADFTPKETIEKVTEVSEKYLEISQFETSNSSFKIGGRRTNSVEKGIYYYLNTEKKTYTYCVANKPVKFTKIILTKKYFDTFLKLRYENIEYNKTKMVNNNLLKIQNSPELNFIFQQIRQSQVEGKLLQLYLESKIMELLSFIISSMDKADNNISVTLTKKDKQNLRKSVAAMKNDLSKHIDAFNLSKIALMSPARYQLAFRKYYGVPPYEYLKELRLNKALLLLKNPENNIYNVAEKVGYKHAGHFSKVFKATYGILPSQYRKMIFSI